MRIVRSLIVLLLCLCLLPVAVAQEETALTAIIPSWENVKPLGRTHPLESSLWLVQSGSGAEFTFYGSHAEITLIADRNSPYASSKDSQPRIAIEVDGVRVVDDMLDAKTKTYIVLDEDAPRDVVIRVVKLSESAQSTCGIGTILVDAPAIRPTENKARRIEFIGDSITCGYGVDDEDRSHHFSTRTEDATKTYAYQTAQLLDADYSLVSYSGHGIVSGYTGTPGVKSGQQLVPAYYAKLGNSYGGAYEKKFVAGIKWDFSAFVPDVIVINLGTNDDSYVKGNKDRAEEFRAGYVAFLKDVREKNPGAMIVCTLGIMGDDLYPTVAKAAADYTAETGDTNIACMRFDVQRASDGYAADWHPTHATHTRAAQKLAAELKKLMGWE